MLQIDAEMIFMRWDEATEEDKAAAARYGMAELGAALTQIEAEIPGIAERVCRGRAVVRDSRQCAAPAGSARPSCSWQRTYADLAAEWDALARRARAALAA